MAQAPVRYSEARPLLLECWEAPCLLLQTMDMEVVREEKGGQGAGMWTLDRGNLGSLILTPYACRPEGLETLGGLCMPALAK